MPLKENVVIGGYGLYFWKSSFDAHQRIMNVCNGHMKYLLQKRSATFAVSDGYENSNTASARKDKVGLNISDSLSGIDFLGPFINKGAVGQEPNPRALPVLALSF